MLNTTKAIEDIRKEAKEKIAKLKKKQAVELQKTNIKFINIIINKAKKDKQFSIDLFNFLNKFEDLKELNKNLFNNNNLIKRIENGNESENE